MSTISQILNDIIHARFGKDVRQAIHDGIEMGYDIASDAKDAAETAQDSAEASATAADASKTAAQTAATNAQNYANQAEQYRNDAFHTTPAGYGEFVTEVNSSLGYLAETGVKNVVPSKYYSSSSNLWAVNSDGTITLNGTTSDVSNFYLAYPSEKYAPPKGTYKWSKGNTNVHTVIQAYNGSNTFVKNLVNTASEDVEFTIDYVGYDRLNVYLQIAANSAWSNDVLYPMIRFSQSDSNYQSPAQSNVALTEKLNNSIIFKNTNANTTTITFDTEGSKTIFLIGNIRSASADTKDGFAIVKINENVAIIAKKLGLEGVSSASYNSSTDELTITCGAYMDFVIVKHFDSSWT